MSWRVDYSELAEAIQEQDQRAMEKLLNELQPRLCAYLRATMNATPEDAEDAVQEAFTKVYMKLMEKNLKTNKYFFKYLLRASRNAYLNAMRYNNRRGGLEDAQHHLVAPSEQIKKLMDEERQHLLRECIETLKKKYRDFVWYYCDQPEWNTKRAASHFGITDNYVRLMKTRSFEKLTDCVNRKLKREAGGKR